MNDGGIWTRLVFSPSTGRVTVDGDSYGVLGVSVETLSSSADPVSLLPDSVARALIDGNGIVRDGELSLVIVPGDNRYHNSVTVVKEKAVEFDLVTDIASGVAGFSPDGTILRWNKRMSYLFGPREKDVKGRFASDVLPAPVLYNWSSVLSSAHMGHEVRIEFRPSGEKRVEGILSRGGPGVIGVFFDSTENYKTGKRLRALNRLNQAYLQSTGTGLLLLDSRLRILLSNTGFSTISGERGSLIGTQLHDVLPEESYRWVHDASERLFGEDRSEQTSTVTFPCSDGRTLTLKLTLRVVRNEVNQAVNFVCLFEDMTEITDLRKDADRLRKSLTGIAELSETLAVPDLIGEDDFCEKVLRITASRAVARYSYDYSETLVLSGSFGEWPSNSLGKEAGDLGLPAYVWRGDAVHRTKTAELGNLAGKFTSCIIVPLGLGVANKGYIILCDASAAGSEPETLKSIASLARLRTSLAAVFRKAYSPDRATKSDRREYASFINYLPFPVALTRNDGTPELWNSSMEDLSGNGKDPLSAGDVHKLIDPDSRGYTLDFLAAESQRNHFSRPEVPDATSYNWHVSIVEQSSVFKRDYGFMIVGFPVQSSSDASDEAVLYKDELLNGLKSLAQALSSHDPRTALGALSEVFRALGSRGAVEFHSNGDLVASFPEETSSSDNTRINSGPSLLLDGVEYEVKTTGGLSAGHLETICEIVSSLKGVPGEHSDLHMQYASGIGAAMNLLAGYIQEFCMEAIRQNSAVISLVENNDPFAGFARTMLYSHETAARAAGLLKLAVSVNPDSFRRISISRFLAGFHSNFAEKGLRPPSFSIEEGIPDVFIIQDIVLEGISMLCMMKSPENVVSFTVASGEKDGQPAARLTMSPMEEPFRPENITAGLDLLRKGVFDPSAESAMIFLILSSSGCTFDFEEKSQDRLSLILQSFPASP